jgi:hypothetical protein
MAVVVGLCKYECGLLFVGAVVVAFGVDARSAILIRDLMVFENRTSRC